MTSPTDIINNSPDDSSTVNLYEFGGDEAAECMLENCVRSLLLTPIDGEYAISPTAKRWNGNETNTSAGGKVGDFALSIKQAFEHFPLVESVTIQVPWYGNQYLEDVEEHDITPAAISSDLVFDDSSEPWSATRRGESVTRGNSNIIQNPDNKGTPSEQSLKDAIALIKSYKSPNGQPIRVILQPIAIIDALGWSDSRDWVATSARGMLTFFTGLGFGDYTAMNSGYNCFMIDMANLAKDTGCESIIVGTGLSGLSTGDFTSEFITAMERTLPAVKAVFTGTNIRIGLACDLDEITALTPLFSNANVHYIAFNYQPALGSWTDDPDAQTPAQQSAKSIYDLDYLRSQIVPPVPDGVVPPGKWIVLHNLGCRSIHRAANAPASDSPPASNGNQDNLMQRAYIEAILSYFGNIPFNSFVAQYDMTRSSVAAWDIRLHSQIHAARPDDIPAWRKGFILNGKVQIPPAPASAFGKFYYCNSDSDLVIDGRTYKSVQIKGDQIKHQGEMTDKRQIITMPRNTPVIRALHSGRYPTPITLTIKRGHITKDGFSNFRTIWAGRVLGAGRSGQEITIEGRAFSTGLSRFGVNRRYGHHCPHALYEVGCRAKRLYIEKMATNVDGNNTIEIDAPSAAGLAFIQFHNLRDLQRKLTPDSVDEYDLAQKLWVNGVVSWQQMDNTVTPPVSQTIEARITRIEEINGGLMIHLARPAPKWGLDENGVPVQVPVKLLVGCNHSRVHCEGLHQNLPNFGGQPNIPAVNPFNLNNPQWW